MALKVYEYKKCSTCRNALKYLDSKNIEYETAAIRETPPTVAELKFMLKQTGNIKRLLNSSGQDYRKLNMKDKIKNMTDAEVIELLSTNGNLIKRPFVFSDTAGTTGFKEEEWEKLFN